jgi:hypothetical protein
MCYWHYSLSVLHPPPPPALQVGFPDIAKAKGAVGRVFRVVDRSPPIDSAAEDGLAPAGGCKGHLELRHVVFAYPSRPSVTVFNNFCLVIPAGGALGHGCCCDGVCPAVAVCVVCCNCSDLCQSAMKLLCCGDVCSQLVLDPAVQARRWRWWARAAAARARWWGWWSASTTLLPARCCWMALTSSPTTCAGCAARWAAWVGGGRAGRGGVSALSGYACQCAVGCVCCRSVWCPVSC